MINPLDLSGKIVLVTGASSGIGKETSIYLSKLGAKIILVSRNEEKLRATLSLMEGDNHAIYVFDLKKIDQIEGLIERVVSQQGKLNGLVHCAGIGDMRPLQMTKYDFIHNMMLINFYAFIELCRVIAKKNIHAEPSSFIAISSTTSYKGEKSKVAYCASKAALDSAIRAMAKELAAKNIRVNSIVPGFIKTEMLDTYIEVAGKEDFQKNVLANQYLGLGEPIDVANAAAYLLSDASKFVTGTGLVIDGGYLS
jgi:NAD(P)-dependent dehydrogenase (short-subunit alcohol dehydrogenase family)